MPEPPLIQQALVRPFASCYQSMGRDPERLLDRCGLAPDPLAAPERMIEEHRLWTFIEAAARDLDLPEFGLVAGERSQLEDLGSLGVTLRQSLTLHNAVETFLGAVNRVSTHATYWAQVEDEQVWFCRSGIPQIDQGERQVELYVLSLLTHVVRLSEAEDWTPTRIRLKAGELHEAALPRGYESAEITLSQPFTAIAFPLRSLGRPVHAWPASALVENLRTHLRTVGPDVPGVRTVAERTGCSPRTLQRELYRHGLTYRRLVDQVRLTRALELLRTERLPLLDAALEVGFSDHPSFTRAFRRWTGSSPEQFRRAVDSSQ